MGARREEEGTVVGVVEDVRYIGATAPTLPEMYFSHRQFGARLDSSVVPRLGVTIAGLLGGLVSREIMGPESGRSAAW